MIDAVVPIHQRSLSFSTLERDDELEVTAHIRDSRPWAAEAGSKEVVHDMELQVTVDKSSLIITRAQATMHAFPHEECPGILHAITTLAGVNIGRGYSREIRNRLGGVLGCSHLYELARSLGPAVIQSVVSVRALERVVEDRGINLVDRPWQINSCHVWAAEGPAVQKLALGWRPGRGPTPAPTVEQLRRDLGPER